MVENELSIADVLAIQGKDTDGFGGQNFLWFILLIFFFGLGGNGFGGGVSNAVTQADLQRGFDQNTVINKLDSLGQGICDSTYALNNSIMGGFYNNELAMVNGFNGVGNAINTLGYQMQQCCCETQKTIREEGNATRALITENTIQGLRDSLSQAQGVISNTTQTQYILSQLGRYVSNPPCPVPSYCGTAM